MTRQAKTLLVVEDGLEYSEAFRREGLYAVPGAAPEIVRAGNVREAIEILSTGARPIDALFLDMVFDRIPEAELAGRAGLAANGDSGSRAAEVRRLAENQGFFILDALAPMLPRGIRVVLAYDFAEEPERLRKLQGRVPELTGLPEGEAISSLLGRLLEGVSR